MTIVTVATIVMFFVLFAVYVMMFGPVKFSDKPGNRTQRVRLGRRKTLK